MDTAHLVADAFERIREALHAALDGLSGEQLARQVGPGANSIAWLAWHLTRVQDDHLADASGEEQVWTRDGWHSRFDLQLDADDTGYGHTPEQVAAVTPPVEFLLGYHDAVYEQTVRFVRSLGASDLDVVVDERWDPPVTLGARLVSVIADDLQHVGQAAYVRGLVS